MRKRFITARPGALHPAGRPVRAQGIGTRLGYLAMAVCMLWGSKASVYAEDYTGGQGWGVEFTGNGMESSFTSADISDAVYALQPGDSVTLFLSLKNSDSQDTDWYMSNQVLSSLEDSQDAANGGAYAYRLSYTGSTGEETILYSSESVGGEKASGAGEGLHEATESLEEFFYLDRLAPGGSGTVTLEVGLDGETQGNAYQNTLASLQMNFAVEKAGTTPGPGGESNTPGSPDSPGGSNTPGGPQAQTPRTPASNAYTLNSVKTGDPAHMLLWSALALMSGVALLVFAVLYMKKGKGKTGAALTLILPLCLAALPFGTVSHAAEGYTYTVTFYPGNHGTFNGTGGVSVQSSGTGASVSSEGQAIKVSGLKNGDMVSFDAAMEGAVALGEGSRYYVKGIRQSGHDNNTIDTAAFRVEGDRDYVVAYGIRGDMTGYTVHYQDGAGNALAPSRNYYGNVGDKPVVAFLYVEGYEPMAYNLTKTLSANEAENVFTFVYRPVPAGTGGGTGDGDTGGNGGNPPSNGSAGTGDAQTPGQGDGGLADGAGNAGEAGMDGTGNGGVNAGAADGGANAGDGMAGNGDGDGNGGQAGAEGNGMDGENVELGDEEVPLDLMELDEEEVPLADNVLPNMLDMEEGSRIFVASAALVIVSVGVLIFFAIWLKKRSR